jgi:ribonuclease HII
MFYQLLVTRWLRLSRESSSLINTAASVLAKVEGDRIMEEYSKKYPEYGFEKHVGYGTKIIWICEKFGPCDIHRRCFGPVKELLRDEI